MLLSYDQFFKIQEQKNNSQNNVKYEYGCVMLMLDIDLTHWNNIIPQIKDEDVYNDEQDNYGIEQEPHITLLFGLVPSEISTTQINEIINEFNFPNIYLEKIDAFKNDKYDVLKFNIDDKDGTLTQINKKLSEFPNENEYPNYNPHVTIGYLKSGKASEYEGDITPVEVKPYNVTYSEPNQDYQDLIKTPIGIYLKN